MDLDAQLAREHSALLGGQLANFFSGAGAHGPTSFAGLLPSSHQHHNKVNEYGSLDDDMEGDGEDRQQRLQRWCSHIGRIVPTGVQLEQRPLNVQLPPNAQQQQQQQQVGAMPPPAPRDVGQQQQQQQQQQPEALHGWLNLGAGRQKQQATAARTAAGATKQAPAAWAGGSAAAEAAAGAGTGPRNDTQQQQAQAQQVQAQAEPVAGKPLKIRLKFVNRGGSREGSAERRASPPVAAPAQQQHSRLLESVRGLGAGANPLLSPIPAGWADVLSSSASAPLPLQQQPPQPAAAAAAATAMQAAAAAPAAAAQQQAALVQAEARAHPSSLQLNLATAASLPHSGSTFKSPFESASAQEAYDKAMSEDGTEQQQQRQNSGHPTPGYGGQQQQQAEQRPLAVPAEAHAHQGTKRPGMPPAAPKAAAAAAAAPAAAAAAARAASPTGGAPEAPPPKRQRSVDVTAAAAMAAAAPPAAAQPPLKRANSGAAAATAAAGTAAAAGARSASVSPKFCTPSAPGEGSLTMGTDGEAGRHSSGGSGSHQLDRGHSTNLGAQRKPPAAAPAAAAAQQQRGALPPPQPAVPAWAAEAVSSRGDGSSLGVVAALLPAALEPAAGAVAVPGSNMVQSLQEEGKKLKKFAEKKMKDGRPTHVSSMFLCQSCVKFLTVAATMEAHPTKFSRESTSSMYSQTASLLDSCAHNASRAEGPAMITQAISLLAQRLAAVARLRAVYCLRSEGMQQVATFRAALEKACGETYQRPSPTDSNTSTSISVPLEAGSGGKGAPPAAGGSGGTPPGPPALAGNRRPAQPAQGGGGGSSKAGAGGAGTADAAASSQQQQQKEPAVPLVGMPKPVLERQLVAAQHSQALLAALSSFNKSGERLREYMTQAASQNSVHGLKVAAATLLLSADAGMGPAAGILSFAKDALDAVMQMQ